MLVKKIQKRKKKKGKIMGENREQGEKERKVLM